MKKECKLPTQPPIGEFLDLVTLRNWHFQYAEIYRRKAQRTANTARVTGANRHHVAGINFKSKAEMHESAVRHLDLVISSYKIAA